MNGESAAYAFEDPQETIRLLQEELARTNREVLALTVELEKRVDERTAELTATQSQLRKTNAELRQLTAELEERVFHTDFRPEWELQKPVPITLHDYFAELVASLALYPEGRGSPAPTAELVFNILEGQRRHRLLDEQGAELCRFHDELPEAARQLLELLGVEREPYGVA